MNKAFSILFAVVVFASTAFGQSDPWGLRKSNADCIGKTKIAIGAVSDLQQLGQSSGSNYGFTPSMGVVSKFSEYDISGNLARSIQQFASSSIPSAYCIVDYVPPGRGNFGRKPAEVNVTKPDYYMVITYGIAGDTAKGREIDLHPVQEEIEKRTWSPTANTIGRVIGSIKNEKETRKIEAIIFVSLRSPQGAKVGPEVSATAQQAWTDYSKTGVSGYTSITLDNPTSLELAKQLVQNAFAQLPR